MCEKIYIAVPDCCDKFNSGVMVLSPSKSVFDDMLSKSVEPLYSSYDGGDQVLIIVYQFNLFFLYLYILKRNYHNGSCRCV
jgi:alpha-N-acetylglucosamine transferase